MDRFTRTLRGPSQPPLHHQQQQQQPDRTVLTKLCWLTALLILVGAGAIIGLVIGIVALVSPAPVPTVMSKANTFVSLMNAMDMVSMRNVFTADAVVVFKPVLLFLDPVMSAGDWVDQISVFMTLLESNHITLSGCNSTASPVMCTAQYVYKYDMAASVIENAPVTSAYFSIVFTFDDTRERFTKIEVLPDASTALIHYETTEARLSVIAINNALAVGDLVYDISKVRTDIHRIQSIYGVNTQDYSLQQTQWSILLSQIDALVGAGQIQQVSVICNTTKYLELKHLFDPFSINANYTCDLITPQTQLTQPIVCSLQGRIDTTCLRDLTLGTLAVENFTVANFAPSVVMPVENGGTGSNVFAGNNFLVTSSQGDRFEEIPSLVNGQIWMGTTNGELPAVGLPTGANGITVVPGVGTFEIRGTLAPTLNTLSVSGATTLGTSTTCGAPVAASCLDISSQTCPVGPLSTQCIPPTGIHLSQLTVDSLTIVQNLTQATALVFNGTVTSLENLDVEAIHVATSLTCGAGASVEPSCVDISSKQCPLGALDASCIPSTLTLVNATYTDTLGINKLVCNGGSIPSNCVSIDSKTCSLPVSDSCIPLRIRSINGVLPSALYNYDISLVADSGITIVNDAGFITIGTKLVGPVSSTDRAIAIWSGLTGGSLIDSGITISAANLLDGLYAIKLGAITGSTNTVTPNYLTLGSTRYGTTAADAVTISAIKLRVYESGTIVMGFSVTNNALNYVTSADSANAPHVFYVGGANEIMRVTSAGLLLSSTNLQFGDLGGSGTTATLRVITMGNSYSAATAYTKAAMKWILYEDSAIHFGTGMTLNSWNFAAPTAAQYVFYAGSTARFTLGTVAAVLSTSLSISGSLTITASTGITMSGGNFAMQTLSADLATTTPQYIEMGSTYYDVNPGLGRNIWDLAAVKLRVYHNSGGVFAGFGITVSQLNHIMPAGWNSVFYVGGTEVMRVGAANLQLSTSITTPGTNDLVVNPGGSNVNFSGKTLLGMSKIDVNDAVNGASTAPASINMGGKYSDTAASPDKLKLKIWSVGAGSGNNMGIGTSAAVMYYYVPTGSSHDFYVNTAKLLSIAAAASTFGNTLTSVATVDMSISSATTDISFNSKTLKDVGSVITTSVKAAAGGGGTIDFGGATLTNALLSTAYSHSPGTPTGWNTGMGSVNYMKTGKSVTMQFATQLTCIAAGTTASLEFVPHASCVPAATGFVFIVPLTINGAWTFGRCVANSNSISVYKSDGSLFALNDLVVFGVTITYYTD